jgi:hypothetical protein
MTTLPPSCAICLEIWEPQPPGTLMACKGLYRHCTSLVTVRKRASLLQLRNARVWPVRWPSCPASVGRTVVLARLAVAMNKERQTYFQKRNYFRLPGPRRRGKLEDMYRTRSETICINYITNNDLLLYFFLPYLKNPFNKHYMSTAEWFWMITHNAPKLNCHGWKN